MGQDRPPALPRTRALRAEAVISAPDCTAAAGAPRPPTSSEVAPAHGSAVATVTRRGLKKGGGGWGAGQAVPKSSCSPPHCPGTACAGSQPGTARRALAPEFLLQEPVLPPAPRQRGTSKPHPLPQEKPGGWEAAPLYRGGRW